MVLWAREENEIESDRRRRYMRTEAQVHDNGAIIAFTRIWTRQPWLGFTGGVDLFALDDNDTILAHSGMRSWGVDGFRIPFKHSDRTEMWFGELNINGASKLDIYHFHAPRDRFNDIVNEVVQKGGKIVDVVGTFSGVYT